MKRTKLKELVINITDGEHGSIQDSNNSNYYLLSNKNIVNGEIIITGSDRRISEESFNKIRKRTKLQENDVVVASVGSIGKTSVIKDKNINYDFQRSVAIVKPDKNKLNSYYLYYFLNLPYVQKQLLNRANGAVQKCLYIGDFEELEIDYFDLPIQHKIVSILSCIDQKITLNNKINTQLEQMAKTIYDYWFVQFDFPDENGKPYKSSGGKMVWNNQIKREIPLEWKVENIETCCEVIDCLHSKKPEYLFEDENSYLLQLENIKDDGLIDLTNKFYVTSNDYSNWTSRIEIVSNDVVITNAGRIAATAQIPTGIKTGLGRNITAIRPFSINPTYLFLFFRSIDMQRQIKWNIDSGAFFSSLNVKGIKNLSVLRPAGNIEDKFEKIVEPFRRERELLNFESQELSKLRDWLLPMLMNGQVTVRD